MLAESDKDRAILTQHQRRDGTSMTKKNDQAAGVAAAESDGIEQTRREFLKGGVAAAGAGLAAATLPGAAVAAGDDCQPENPYGSRPGGGISLPEYY